MKWRSLKQDEDFLEESYSGVPDFWRDEPRFRNLP
jgi:hypothetical protein